MYRIFAQNPISRQGPCAVRLDALTGLTAGRRAELHRRVAELFGAQAIGQPGGRPHALGPAGLIELVHVLLRSSLAQDQAASIFGTDERPSGSLCGSGRRR